VHKVGDLADSTRVGEAVSNKEKLGPWPEKKKKA
jgi:pyruvate kinase